MDVRLHEVMTVDEVASYLRVPRGSVYKLAQLGRIPCQKVGRHWRFSRGALEMWLGNAQGFTSGDFQNLSQAATDNSG